MRHRFISVVAVSALAISLCAQAQAGVLDLAVRDEVTRAANQADLPLDGSVRKKPSWKRKALAFGGLGAAYGVLYGWTFMAWHYRSVEGTSIKFHKEGWFDASTYAGGADKLGHAWANYTLTRGGSRLLRAGGWSKGSSLIASTALSLGFFTLSEIKDGYNPKYGFSPNDMVANVTGQALGITMELVPWIDERFDFRMEYLPSKAFLDQASEEGLLNSAEDYSGQNYRLAYHLGSIKSLRSDKNYSWLRFVDVSVGFHADAFSPKVTGRTPRQDLSLGLTLNLQELFKPGALRFTTEVFAPPYTTLPLITTSRERVEPTSASTATMATR